MEEKDSGAQTARESVKKLLEIARKAEKIVRERGEVQTYLIRNRDTAKRLGEIVAAYSGFEKGSKEGARLGALVAIRCFCESEGSLQFLEDAANGAVEKKELKRKIEEFLRRSQASLEKEREEALVWAEKEKHVLKALKRSERAARSAPAWKREIEELEEKIKKMEIFLKTDGKEKKSMEEISKSRKSEQKKSAKSKISKAQRALFLKSLESLAGLRCLCNFQKNTKVQKHALARELILSAMETPQMNFLHVLPKVCQGGAYKVSVEACAPCAVPAEYAPLVELYAIETLKAIAHVVKRGEDKVEACKSMYQETGALLKTALEEVFLEISPLRKKAVRKTFESQDPRVFLANLVRILYLSIHDAAIGRLSSESAKIGTGVTDVLQAVNREHHRKLIRQEEKKRRKEPTAEKTQTMHVRELRRPSVYKNTFIIIQLVSEGIFTETGTLSNYFRKYHRLRTLVLNAACDLLVDSIASAAFSKIHNRAEGSLQRMGRTPPSFKNLVRIRVLGFVRIMAIRFLRTNISAGEFADLITEEDLDRRGISGSRKDVVEFVAAAIPLFSFSVSSLR